MKTGIKLGIAGLTLLTGLALANYEAKAQSRETQLKIIGGELLQESPNKFSRKVGKILSTSGLMQYEMEKAKAGSTNISVEQNNFPVEHLIQSEDGKYFPAPGYEWVDPENVGDPRLRKINSLESRATLASFDMRKLEEEYRKMQVASTGEGLYYYTARMAPMGVGSVFTCKWYRDFDEDGLSLKDNDFQGIKRTFGKEEKLEIIGFYGINLVDVKRKKFPVTAVVTLELYRKEDGKFLGKEKREHVYEERPFDSRMLLMEHFPINSGALNPDKYVYNLKLSFPDHTDIKFNFPKAKTGEFEILE